MHPLWKGIAIGFSIAAPVGPIGLLCMRRAMTEGRLVGFVSGLGAATADAGYGILAAAGLTAISNVLLAHRVWLQLFGGAFLVYIGWQIWRSPPATRPAEARPATNLASAYGSTLVLTVANPMTVLSFLGIFAGVGVSPGNSSTGPWWLVVGVFLGSAAWWLTLSTVAGWIGGRLRPAWLRAVNIAAALVILAFGFWQLASVVQSLR